MIKDTIIDNRKYQIKLIWFCLVAVLFFTGFYLINSNTGFLGDDYLYHFVYCDYPDWGTAARITGFRDILTSMAAEYRIETGRIPVHIAVQLLLLFDKAVFNVCNSLVAVLLGILIYFHANYGNRHSLLLIIFIYSLLWFFIPAADLSMVMLTGSVNYLWACTFILLFLMPYRIYAKRQRASKHPLICAIVMAPIGLLAGWSHETIGGVAVLMAMLYSAYYYRNKIKLPAWAITGVVSAAIGLIIMIAAPGSHLRASRISNNEPTYSFIDNVKYVIKGSFSFLYPLLGLLFIALVLLLYFRYKRNSRSSNKRKARSKNEFIDSLMPAVFCFISAIASFVVLIFAPYFTPRELFVSSTFLIIAICIVVLKLEAEINIRERQRRLITILIISVCSIAFAVDATMEYQSCSFNYRMQTGIEEQILSQVESGQKNIVFKGEYFFKSSGHFNIYKAGDPGTIFSIGLDPNYPTNKLFAQYYGAETLINEAKLTLID